MSDAIQVGEVPSDIHVVPCPCGHGSGDIMTGNALFSGGCIAAAAANHRVGAFEEKWLGLKVVDESGHPLVGATVRVFYAGSTVSTALVGACGFMRIDGLLKGGCYDIEVDDRPTFLEHSQSSDEESRPTGPPLPA